MLNKKSNINVKIFILFIAFVLLVDTDMQAEISGFPTLKMRRLMQFFENTNRQIVRKISLKKS